MLCQVATDCISRAQSTWYDMERKLDNQVLHFCKLFDIKSYYSLPIHLNEGMLSGSLAKIKYTSESIFYAIKETLITELDT